MLKVYGVKTLKDRTIHKYTETESAILRITIIIIMTLLTCQAKILKLKENHFEWAHYIVILSA